VPDEDLKRVGAHLVANLHGEDRLAVGQPPLGGALFGLSRAYFVGADEELGTLEARIVRAAD
jgi:hypothetical protein